MYEDATTGATASNASVVVSIAAVAVVSADEVVDANGVALDVSSAVVAHVFLVVVAAAALTWSSGRKM